MEKNVQFRTPIRSNGGPHSPPMVTAVPEGEKSPVLQATVKNRLLRAMTSRDFYLLQGIMQPVRLDLGSLLAKQNESIDRVFFLESGIASDVAGTGGSGQQEACFYGCDGFSGSCLLLGIDRTPYDQLMRIDGTAFEIEAHAFRSAVKQSSSLESLLLGFAYVLSIQAGFNAMSNAGHPIVERLARRILMYQDRLGDELHITHGDLSDALNVRRAGVTDGIHILEGDLAIKSTRRRLRVRDRDKLIETARCYGPPEDEYERLIGPMRFGFDADQTAAAIPENGRPKSGHLVREGS